MERQYQNGSVIYLRSKIQTVLIKVFLHRLRQPEKYKKQNTIINFKKGGKGCEST